MSFARSLTTASAADREGTDFYPTPPECTHALLDWLEDMSLSLPGQRVWEPACGEGHISEVLKRRGYKVDSSDLHDRGYGLGQRDFLAERGAITQAADWIITNPPFSQAEDFIRYSLTLNRPFAFLLKGQFWHAARRQALFEQRRPLAVLPLTWRPDFLMGRKGGSPTMEAAWTVWGNVDARATAYVPLTRPVVAS